MNFLFHELHCNSMFYNDAKDEKYVSATWDEQKYRKFRCNDFI